MSFQLVGRSALAGDALDRPITLDIPANTRLEDALIEWGTKAGMTVMINTPTVEHETTQGVRGTLRAGTALSVLLRDSGLSYTAEDGRIRVIPATTLVRSAKRELQPGSPAAQSSSSEAQANPSSESEVQKNAEPGATSSQPDARRKELETVVVTAQKREERLIDTPQSISVLSADALAKIGAVQFRDFANTVPGLSFQTAGAGYTQISLRGVTTGVENNPSVGIYVDDVPVGSSTAFAFGARLALDLGVFDVDRIEVLRGPQGTLYGASTMGGLIKYTTTQPDTTGFVGTVQTGISGTEYGSVSHNVMGAVNAPIITDKVAVRMSGFESRDGGYIDNVALGQKDANRSRTYGGRVELLFTPTNALTIRIGGLLQNIARDGQSTSDYTFAGVPEYGSLNQYRLFAETFDQQFRLVSGVVAYNFGPATLTSVSGYQTMRTQDVYDLSAFFVPLLQTFLGRSYSGTGFLDGDTTHKFTQELRLVSNGTNSLEWLVGGFYTHEASDDVESFNLRDVAGQPAPNDLFTALAPSKFEEYAVFGDLTYRLTSKFDVTGGIRHAWNDQVTNSMSSGLFSAGPYPAPIRSSQRVFTYLANARYHFSDRATGYVRFATGYRPGGPNPVSNNPITGVPEGSGSFQPDRLKSYEAGYKAETADRTFGIDLAGYYIDWKNIQVLTVFSDGFGGFANAGAATVRGAELTLTARPTSGFTLAGAFAYQDAKLSQAAPDVGGADGERLPNVPRFTTALNTDYEFTHRGLRPTIGATLRHVSDRMASFNNSASYPQYRLPAYTTVDLRSGFLLSSVNVQLYVHNVFDERGQLSANTGYYANQVGPVQVSILQPRTIGISATTHF